MSGDAEDRREQKEPNELLAAALYYARLGYPVFPLVPWEKKPLTAHGLLEATTDEEQIVKWWAATPLANVGIATNQLLVLDVDGPDNPWCFADEERLSSLNAALAIQRTGNRGLQFFFRQPPGCDWRNTAAKIAHNVDTRGNGGYVVVPPSQLEPLPDPANSSTLNYRAYAWLPRHELRDVPEALPEPPGWLVVQLDQLATGQRFTFATSASGPQETIGEIPKGRRNHTLTSLAGSMRRCGLSEDAIFQALQSTNSARCMPPLPAGEVQRIAASVARYEPDQITTALAEGGVYLAEGTSVDGGEKTRQHPGTFPPRLLQVPGLLGTIMRHNLESAIAPQPVLGLGAAVALMATITGHRLTDQFETQTNLYVIGLCASGGGKEHARKLNKQILSQSAWEETIAPESIGSSAGLISILDEQRLSLFQIDEIGRFLKTLQHPDRAPHLYNIVTVLLRLFTSSGNTYVGDAYADTKKTKKIYWPHCCLYGTTVPESFYMSLTREALSDGFVARLLVFETDEPRPEHRRPRLRARDLPPEIIAAVKAWHDFTPGGGNLSKENPQPRALRYSEEAERLTLELQDLCRQEERADRDGLGSIWLRTVEKARKLAILYAASQDGTEVLEVGQEAMAWGCELSEYLTRRMLYEASEHVAENQFEDGQKRVLRAIRQTGGKGLSKNQVTRGFQTIRKKFRDEILECLVETGRVVVRAVRRGARGPESLVYIALEHADLANLFGGRVAGEGPDGEAGQEGHGGAENGPGSDETNQDGGNDA